MPRSSAVCHADSPTTASALPQLGHSLRRIGSRLTHPIVGWLALVAGLCLWHIPAAFETALRSPAWHEVEHATFFPRCHPVLVAGDPSLSVAFRLAALDHPALPAGGGRREFRAVCHPGVHRARDLPTHAAAPRLFGTTALGDQASAGVIMWVPGSIAFLVPAVVVAVQYLSPRSGIGPPRTSFRPGAIVRGPIEFPCSHRLVGSATPAAARELDPIPRVPADPSRSDVPARGRGDSRWLHGTPIRFRQSRRHPS